MISDIWMILDNFLDNYSILWDLMDMICIVLKKNYYTQPLLELLFLKSNFENTYWTCSKQHNIIEKRTVKQVASVLLW